jgi:hypothetical protein
MMKDAEAAKAAEFRGGVDGTEYVDPPPHGSFPISLLITLELSERKIAPSGPVKLEGMIPETNRQDVALEQNPAGPSSHAEAPSKLRNATAPALESVSAPASWYLMVPPLSQVSHELDRTAPPNQWSIVDSVPGRSVQNP